MKKSKIFLSVILLFVTMLAFSGCSLFGGGDGGGGGYDSGYDGGDGGSDSGGDSGSDIGEWYTVTFNSQGGSGVVSQKVDKEEGRAVEPNDPTKTDYIFGGWYTSKNCNNGEEFNFNTVINKNMTLYAKWIGGDIDTYCTVTLDFQFNFEEGNTISYDIEKGGIVAELDIDLGEDFREGYTFGGWYTNAQCEGQKYNLETKVNEDITLYAKWIPHNNTLVFNKNNWNATGTMVNQTIASGSIISLPTNTFTRLGYTFRGWSTTANGEVEYADGASYTMGINTSYTLYAVWAPNNNTVIFNKNDEDATGTMANQVIAFGDFADLSTNTFTKEGYAFLGWSTTADGEVEYEDEDNYLMGINSSYTLYAKWAESVKITFDSQGGSDVESQNVVKGERINLIIDPQKAGYTFVGWYYSAECQEGDEYDFATRVSVDFVLYAKWLINNNTLRFNRNNIYLVGIMDDLKINTNDTISLPTNTFGKPGWTFIGWSTTSDGEVEYEDGASYTMGTNSIYTLYAVWTINDNTLIFDENGDGTTGTMANQTITTGITISLPTNTFIRAGYTFEGWAITATGKVKYADEGQYTMGTNASYTLYAVWAPNNNTLVFDKNDEDAKGSIDSRIMATGSTISLPTNTFTRKGYTFEGWSTTIDGDVEYENGASYTMGTNAENTLYAVWLEIATNLQSFNFELTEDGTGYILKKFTGNETNITIPTLYNRKPIVEIGASAFENCSITSVIIGKEVTSIGNYAFKDCTNLTSITIPDSVTKIEMGAFEYCSSLPSIEIPDSVTSIGFYAFEYCTGLTSFKIPNNLTKIEMGVFKGCSNLNSVTIPNSVTEIGKFAFLGCSSLRSIEIPNSVTTIGLTVFRECTSLTSIKIPDSVTSMGDYLFIGCTNLTSITLPYLNTLNNLFGSSSIGYDVPSSLKTVVITCADSIGPSAFQNCSTLTSIILNDSITSIGGQAFFGCSSLYQIEIPNSVTSIGFAAFYGCSSLYHIVMPQGVTSIGDQAFQGCSSLRRIIIPKSVTSMGSSVFRDCSTTDFAILCRALKNEVSWGNTGWNSGCYVEWGWEYD